LNWLVQENNQSAATSSPNALHHNHPKRLRHHDIVIVGLHAEFGLGQEANAARWSGV
jgi:hypothetical protein